MEQCAHHGATGKVDTRMTESHFQDAQVEKTCVTPTFNQWPQVTKQTPGLYSGISQIKQHQNFNVLIDICIVDPKKYIDHTQSPEKTKT